eukprot:GFUD01130467.1.p1 GENE.GFUD01130467.1~~GFUD01130467.1.p1  ORF type:complete len:182 (-),score=41.10 GFUD01130467.1:126-644(-)
MALKSSKNVWGNSNRDIGGSLVQKGRKEKIKTDSWGSFGHSGGDKKMSNLSSGGCFSVGPFGSNFESDSGQKSLPAFGSNKISSIYRFELESSSSGTLECGPNPVLTFGMEPTKFTWSSKSLETTSGGSSRTSSSQGSNNQLDWTGTVENVFKEEIKKMAEGSQWLTGFGAK